MATDSVIISISGTTATLDTSSADDVTAAVDATRVRLLSWGVVSVTGPPVTSVVGLQVQLVTGGAWHYTGSIVTGVSTLEGEPPVMSYDISGAHQFRFIVETADASTTGKMEYTGTR